MGTPITQGSKPRNAGITETRLSAITGLRNKQFTLWTAGAGLGVSQSMATSILFNHTMQVGTTGWVKLNAATVPGLTGTWLHGKLGTPVTPCITLLATAPLINHRVSIRVSGEDQFGTAVISELPQMTFLAPYAVNYLRIWLPWVFSRVDTIEYQFPDAFGGTISMSCGVYFTWDPTLTNSPFNTTWGSLYVFPLNQGIGTSFELVGSVGASPNFYPEVTGFVVTGPTPSSPTICNVPPFSALPSQGGYSLSGNETGVDAVTGIAYSHRLLRQDPHKVRISSTLGGAFPIKCLDQATDFNFYNVPNGANPELPLTVNYNIRVRVADRGAVRLVGPVAGP